jgi:hypothetical protein
MRDTARLRCKLWKVSVFGLVSQDLIHTHVVTNQDLDSGASKIQQQPRDLHTLPGRHCGGGSAAAERFLPG